MEQNLNYTPNGDVRAVESTILSSIKCRTAASEELQGVAVTNCRLNIEGMLI